MIDIKDIVLWTNRETKEVMIWTHPEGRPEKRPGQGRWSDPIGAHYTQWRKMKNPQRVQLMTETAIDLAMQGYSLKHVLTVFAEVKQFRALGAESCPMCRALTTALVGQTLDAMTMSFDELLVHYRPRRPTPKTTSSGDDHEWDYLHDLEHEATDASL